MAAAAAISRGVEPGEIEAATEAVGELGEVAMGVLGEGEGLAGPGDGGLQIARVGVVDLHAPVQRVPRLPLEHRLSGLRNCTRSVTMACAPEVQSESIFPSHWLMVRA